MAEKNIIRVGSLFDQVDAPVSASSNTERGNIAAVVTANGQFVTASDISGQTVQGMFTDTKDNSAGASGDLTNRVERGIYQLTLSGSADGSRLPNAGDTGAMTYVINSTTVSFNSGTNSVKVGPARRVIDSTTVEVEVGGASNLT